MSYRLDLHTHSVASPDGSLATADYWRALKSGQLDFIAVTDHNTIAFAQELHKNLGAAIIVGEEISTSDGHLIGLFLRKRIEPGLTAAAAADLIIAQNGLVYVPHPFEKRGRQGLSRQVLDSIAAKVDIIEVYNGRANGRRHGLAAANWATKNNKPTASSSDAHGWHGWQRSYSYIALEPTRQNLAKLLMQPELSRRSVGVRGRLYPTLNRLKKRLGHA